MDDDEVVLKGSELEKLLLSVRADVETFSPNPECLLSSVIQETPSCSLLREDSNLEKAILVELSCLKQLLLSCGLMLDEDIAFLVNLYPHQHEQKSYLGRLDQILLPGCCIMLVLSGYRHWMNLKWSIPLFLSSIGPTVYISYKFFQVTRLKYGMEELLAEMKILTRFIKKTTKSIKENMAIVKTRLVLSTFRKMKPELMDRYYLQVKSDINTNAHKFIKFLLEIICITREATRRIIGTGAFTNCSQSFFLASCSNEELGFPSLDDDSVTWASISKLEDLCIEYLVMQSEYLRALGMWLCSPVHTTPDDVSSNISFYKENISKKHKIAQQVFSGALFTRYVERSNLPVHQSTDIALTKMNSALMALIIEAISLGNSVNEMEHDSLNRSHIDLGISNLESCFSDCTEIFKEVRSIKQKSKDSENTCIKSSLPGSENNLSAQKTGVEVGYSDFSVSGEDKVYLCITDTDESMDTRREENMLIDEIPKYPTTLLHELRGVLEQKRLEFRQREFNAIKSSDLEAVENQFDLVLLNRPVERITEPPTVGPRNGASESIASRMPIFPVSHQQSEGSSDISLSQSIAAKVAKTSATWKCNTEELFGDVDDDESVSSD